MIHLNQSILVYPEYTYGAVPKARTTYFGVDFPAPQGVPKIAVNEDIKIQPISLRRISDYPQFEIVFYDPIVPNKFGYNVDDISNKIHTSIESIVKSEISQWWYWEVFQDNSNKKRGRTL